MAATTASLLRIRDSALWVILCTEVMGQCMAEWAGWVVWAECTEAILVDPEPWERIQTA